jgi:hypothetical protein
MQAGCIIRWHWLLENGEGNVKQSKRNPPRDSVLRRGVPYRTVPFLLMKHVHLLKHVTSQSLPFHWLQTEEKLLGFFRLHTAKSWLFWNGPRTIRAFYADHLIGPMCTLLVLESNLTFRTSQEEFQHWILKKNREFQSHVGTSWQVLIDPSTSFVTGNWHTTSRNSQASRPTSQREYRSTRWHHHFCFVLFREIFFRKRNLYFGRW